MLRRLRVSFSIAAAVLTSSLFAAQQPWDAAPFSSDPKALLDAAAKVQPKSDEDGVVVLLDEARFSFDAKGLVTRTERLVFRITSESAVETWASIEAPWAPWYEERPTVEARVVTKDGAVHHLDPKSFGVDELEDEPSMFSDDRVLSGPIPAVEIGSVIEQRVTYKEKNPLYEAGIAQRYRFGRWVETQQTRLVVEHPATLTFHLANRTNPEIKPLRTEKEGVVTLLFESGRLPAVEFTEWNRPSDQPNYSYVAFSTGKSWQDVARRYSEIIDKQITSAGDIAASVKIKALVGGAKQPREIAAKLLDRISRDIRYAGVEFGEGSIVPRTPAETLSHKYGDCKDKATLLVAMLRSAGVPANAALLKAGQGDDIERDLPGLGGFNHAIVHVPGSDPFWIDPTDEFSRAGELPDQDQGRLALIATPETTQLVLTPSSTSADNKTIETREFFLAEDGKSRVVEITEYHGSSERATRRYYAETDAKSIRESLESYVKNVYLAEALGKYETSDPRDLSKPFTVRVEALRATRGITAGGEAAVGIFEARLFTDMPYQFKSSPEEEEELEEKEKPKKRVSDFVYSDPFTYEMRYRIVAPPGYAPRALPESKSETVVTATVAKEFSVGADGLVMANYRIDSGPRRITAAQYEEMRTALSPRLANEAFLLMFDQIGNKHLVDGEIGKAIAEFRRMAALHPKEALHHADVARALLAAGLGTAAREEARRAVAIEPKSSLAHQILGSILACDLIGREFAKGFDHKGSIAAYRKAKELDPKNGVARAQLAVVLQRNSEGVWYGLGAPLNEAIDEYLAMKKDIETAEKDVIDRELMVLYLRANRIADLEKLLASTKDTFKKDTYQLVATALQRGAAAAIAAAQKLDLSKRRDAISEAAAILAVMRKYPEGAELLSAAVQGAPNAAELRARVDLMRKMKRTEDIVIDPNEPESVFRSFYASAIASEPEEKMMKLLTAEIQSVLKGDSSRARTNELATAGAKFQNKARNEATSPAFYIDVLFAALELQREGSEDVGYRLLTRAPGFPAEEMTTYVVREKDQYRIAAMAFAPSLLGLKALRLSEAGNDAAAKQWLDWARDVVKSGSGDDPVASEPFPALWNGKTDATPEDVRIAAATLVPDTKQMAEIALPRLIELRSKTPEEQQWRIDQALATTYKALERWDDLLTVADRLAAKHPRSASAFELGATALIKLDRDKDADKRAEARLAEIPTDATALRFISRRALATGDYAKCRQYAEKLLKLSSPDSSDYNLAAWSAVFVGGDLQKAVEEARHAVALKEEHYGTLNTLATLYAEMGLTAEARETLLLSLEASERGEISSPDWYVIGRIAETYGLKDAAIDAYKRVEKSGTLKGAPYDLAQKRLAALK